MCTWGNDKIKIHTMLKKKTPHYLCFIPLHTHIMYMSSFMLFIGRTVMEFGVYWTSQHIVHPLSKQIVKEAAAGSHFQPVSAWGSAELEGECQGVCCSHL